MTSSRPRVGILSAGLWRQRQEIATLLGAEPVRIHTSARHVDMIAGWGRKETSLAARRLAGQAGIPYIAIEDGLLRSVEPRTGPSMSYVVDTAGIYYDATGPSDLEAMLQQPSWVTPADCSRAQAAIGLLRSLRLSKYNSVGSAAGNAPRGRILVIDQVAGDASVVGAGAGAAAFEVMLASALARAGRDEIAIKVHPETVAGLRPGYLAERARDLGLRVITDGCNVWDLVDGFEQVFTVSSQLGFEALMAGRAVVCFGVPFYAGWGLTQDHIASRSRTARPSLETLTAAVLFRYSRYLDPWDRRPVEFEDAARHLAFLRDRHLENVRPIVAAGLSRLKRRVLRRFLHGPAGPPHFVRTIAQAAEEAARHNGVVLVWGCAGAAPAAARGVPVIRVEDGFIRSVGLGASFVAASSLTFDREGIDDDATRPSGFERLAGQGVSDPGILARAARLRAAVIDGRISKYNEGTSISLPRTAGRHRILVPGQVEDDAGVILGSPDVRRNADLLKRVRQRNPDAFILFKPHPDVERGYRRGRISESVILRHADAVARNAPMPDLLDWCDQIDTITSLTGFEGLLRKKQVVVYGQPFYAGWGLTEDLVPLPRRRRSLSLDEFVAIALILYPRYVDPVSGLPCSPEILVSRFAGVPHAPSTLAAAGLALRHAAARTRRLVLGPVSALRKSRAGI